MALEDPVPDPTDLREDALDDLYEAPQVASKVLVAAMGLIETLTVTQRAHLVLPLDAPQRQDWDIIPRPEGTGLSLHDLSRSQKILARDLLAAALPLRTFTQATQVPQLEHVLRDYEADFLGRAIGRGGTRTTTTSPSSAGPGSRTRSPSGSTATTWAST